MQFEIILKILITTSILLMAQSLRAGAFFETGSADITDTIDNGTWVTVNTQKTYTSPVVIAGPITHSNGNSLSVRVRAVTGNSFQLGMQSPCENLGATGGGVTCAATWSTETVNWMVVERGTWVFPDGTKIEAYLHNTNEMRSRFGGNNNGGDTITYSHTYSAAPTVLHTINSFNDPEWVSTTVYGNNRGNPPTNTQFTLALEGAEAVTSHGNESIGWVAIERTSGTNNGVPYVAARTGGRIVDRHNDECQALSYGTTFAGIPNLLSQHNSMNGGDGAWLRLCGNAIEATQFNVHMEEDQVNDSERTGIDEYAAWFAFEANSVGALEFLTATKSFTDEDSDGQIGPGELVTFNVTLTNLQDDFAQANNATDEFVDTLDANFEFESIISASSGTLTNSGQDIFWNGSIPASGTVDLSYRVRVADSATVCTSANIPNQAQLNMDPIDNAIEPADVDNLNNIVELSDDPTTDNGGDLDLDGLTADDDPTLVTVGCLSNVSVSKDDGATTYTPGQNTTYTIIVSNAGPHNLIGAIINDTLPPNVTNNGNWVCDPAVSPGDGTASCISGSLAGTTESGTGDVNLTVDIPSGKSLVITLPVSYSVTP